MSDERLRIFGPDGIPVGIARVEISDAGDMTYRGRGETVTIDPRENLMAMARRRRDGVPIDQIAKEFAVVFGEAGVTRRLFETALDAGEVELNRAIARGEQPAETYRKVLVMDDDDDD